MKTALLSLFLATALQLAAAAPGLPSTNVAWQPAASDADVQRATCQALLKPASSKA